MKEGEYLWLTYSEKKISVKGDLYTEPENILETDANKKDEKFLN